MLLFCTIKRFERTERIKITFRSQGTFFWNTDPDPAGKSILNPTSTVLEIETPMVFILDGCSLHVATHEGKWGLFG